MAETEFVLKLKREQFVSSTKRAEKEWRGAIGKMQREVGGLGSSFEGEAKKVETASERTAAKVAGITSQITKLGIATALSVGGKQAITQFARFEKGLIGVGKTADIEGKALQEFGDDIQGLSREIPVSTAELLELSQAAGQLGVKGTKNLLQFSRVMAELAAASDVQGESGALQITRILGVANEDIAQVDEFTNVLVGLGNEVRARESEILEVATKVSQATAAFELSSTEVLGLSAGYKSLGVEADLAGSTTQKAFIAIKDAITEGGESLHTLISITGQTREQLQQLYETDQAELLSQFIEGLNGVKDSGGDVIATLEALGIKEVRAVSTLSAAAKGYDTFAKAIRQAGIEAKENNARQTEAEKAFASLDAQIDKTSGSLGRAGEELGELFSPFASATLSLASKMLDDIAGSIETVNQELRDEQSTYTKVMNELSGAARLFTSGTFGFYDDEVIGLAEALLYPVSTYKELTGAAKEANKEVAKTAEALSADKIPADGGSVGTIIDLSKGLAKQAKLTAQQVELSAKSMAKANELSARKSIRAIEKQISKLQEAAGEAQQLQKDIDSALSEIGKVSPSKASDATDAIVRVRRSATTDNPEETIKLGREALEIIEQLRSDGVIDDRLAKAQLSQLKGVTESASKEIEQKSEQTILQLEEETKKFEALKFGFDKATVTREADKIVEILNGRLKNLVPGIASLGPQGKSLNPANFDTTNNIIKPLPDINRVPAERTIPPAAPRQNQKLEVSVSADSSLQQISAEINRAFGIDGVKLVETVMNQILSRAASAEGG